MSFRLRLRPEQSVEECTERGERGELLATVASIADPPCRHRFAPRFDEQQRTLPTAPETETESVVCPLPLDGRCEQEEAIHRQPVGYREQGGELSRESATRADLEVESRVLERVAAGRAELHRVIAFVIAKDRERIEPDLPFARSGCPSIQPPSKPSPPSVAARRPPCASRRLP